MPIPLSHKSTRIYHAALDLVEICYQLTEIMPKHEQYSLQKQIRRAVLSIILNISEGSSRFTAAERKRFYEIARSSLVEVDTGFTIAVRLKYFSNDQLTEIDSKMMMCFGMLSKMIDYQSRGIK